VTVLDNGTGMPPDVLQLALQFGGTTRDRDQGSLGRYGIGLPGSSMSQARRLDVYTWTSPGPSFHAALSLDDVRAGKQRGIPVPKRVPSPVTIPDWAPTGTLVVWTSCDRVIRPWGQGISRLRRVLGRTFRESIWAGATIRLNGHALAAVDPLHLHEEDAAPYGPPLTFDLRIGRRPSRVTVRFSELPIEDWHGYTPVEKRRLGVTKGAGVSVLRSQREIDAGWFFMGTKRRENYDDWWRCEVAFLPDLDELFGVTHTKQGIHPTESLDAVLTPDVERIAHALNRRVRDRFAKLKKRDEGHAVRRAEAHDHLLEPPAGGGDTKRSTGPLRGLRYRVVRAPISDERFYSISRSGDELTLTFNASHPFAAALDGSISPQSLVELLLLASARAELALTTRGSQRALSTFRTAWSNALAAFLG